ncbi:MULTISPECIES: recombinase family protein [Polaromonas]|uniref:Recombinase family protein n=1 Tax=Polaromonas aquatica TaxID=332657 RepID=A0ABW1U0U2_9BURK
MFIRAYLRASTQEQDAQRARAALDAFAEERGLAIAAYYAENESGASLKRPELFRLLADSKAGDVLLIEQVDRLSRLSDADWQTLKVKIQEKRVRVVALDLPTSWQLATPGDELTRRMLEALNGMMLDMLAAIARKDYEDRRRRTAEGIAKAKQVPGKYRGKPEDVERNTAILALLAAGNTWSQVCAATGASRSTLSRLTKAKAAVVMVA